MPGRRVTDTGGRTIDQLQWIGIVTIADFVAMNSRLVRDLLTLAAATRKGIAVTRSFGRPVTTLQEMREAVAAYASRDREKRRAEGLQACHMAVFL